MARLVSRLACSTPVAEEAILRSQLRLLTRLTPTLVPLVCTAGLGGCQARVHQAVQRLCRRLQPEGTHL